MGYPPEPEEPGSNKSCITCGFLFFSFFFLLFFMWLAAGSLFTGGYILIFFIPLLISTFVIAKFIIERTKSPTIRQVAMYYQFILISYFGLIVFVAGIALLVMIGERL